MFLALLLTWLGALHPDSKSSSRIVVRDNGVQIEIACQEQSLLESVPLDTDLDGVLSTGELELGRAQIERYALANYRLSLAPEPFVALSGALLAVESQVVDGGAFEERRVLVRLRYDLPAGASGLTVRVSLFRDRNPLHRDAASLQWFDEPAAGFLFGEGADVWVFEPVAQRRISVLRSYVLLGFDHIRGGWDHLAFLLGLIVAARNVRSLVGVVTAFTVAHSVTLASAALGWIDAPGRLVELAIALSIAYVGAESLLFRRPGARWVEAFGFGLIHGLGFAGFVGDSLMAEPLQLTALFGFNLGVELGQVAAVLVAALVLRWLPGERRFEDDPRGWFAPRWFRTAGALTVLGAGAYWFLERAGWL